MKKFLVFFISIVFLAGCKSTEDPNGCSIGFHMQDGICVEDFEGDGEFTSSDDIVNLFLTFSKKQELLASAGFWGWARNDVMFEMDGVDAEPASDEDTGSDDYSGTNNQVEGVDEMDNVLTDGKYIYVSNYNKIQIILAYTQQDEYDVLDIVKEITFDELSENDYFYFNGMYVDEDRLLVVGTSNSYTCNGYYEEKGEEVTPGTDDEPSIDGEVEGDSDIQTEDWDYQYCRYYEYHNTTHIYEYSKDDFELINEYELSGSFIGSRKINDDVYFVTTEYIPFYYMEYDDYEFDIDNFIPTYSINGVEVNLSYADISYVEGTQPQNFTTFYGLSLDSKEISTEVVLGEGGYNLYVSTDNIYLTGQKWTWNNDLLMVLEEAENPEDVEVEEDPFEVETSIVRVEIEEGVVSFGVEGSVPGIALDQFAMDEKDGYVRIVTTTNNWWWWGMEQEINNRLMVLDMDLNIISTLENLGKEGESVQSTRFVGDFAYVVTFLRTDPFYVIDVSDPENPQKLSELEIPGFSDYLQPIGEDYILGIGYGDNEGGTQGLKISLYDVSDKENAVVASEIVYPYADTGYIWTSTVYNHKDLLVSIDKGIIALPYTEYDWGNDDWNWTYHSGILVLNLDVENGEISERGRVEHSEANTYDIYVYKSKFISDYLYTISSKYVMVSTIEDPETVLNQVQIGESREYYYPEEPVDPEVEEVICEDGFVEIDGECQPVEQVNEFPLFDEFEQINSWDNVLVQDEPSYYVFVYGNNCDFCREIEEQMYEFAHQDTQLVYFINNSLVDDPSDALVDALPTLLYIEDGVITEEYVGMDTILDIIT
jgi:uncharacterized secreted protein with C-terminal beta-propeller domain